MTQVKRRFSGKVEAQGEVYQVLDQATFLHEEDDQGNESWSIRSRSGLELVITGGDTQSVVVNGRVESPDLVPQPWGLLMAFAGIENHVMGAYHLTNLGEGSLEFETVDYVVLLDVNQDGYVTRKRSAPKADSGAPAEDVRITAWDETHQT